MLQPINISGNTINRSTSAIYSSAKSISLVAVRIPAKNQPGRKRSSLQTYTKPSKNHIESEKTFSKGQKKVIHRLKLFDK